MRGRFPPLLFFFFAPCLRTCVLAGVALTALFPLPAHAAPFLGSPLVKIEPDPARAIRGSIWAIAKSTDGTLFVGSNVLSAFDGHRWEPVNAPGYAFRALAPGPQGEVWIGARGAIGRIQRDAKGAWQFESIHHHVRAGGVDDPNDISCIHPVGDAVFFVSSERLLRWDGTRMESWELPARPRLQAFPTANGIVVYQPQSGLLQLGPTGGIEVLIDEADLPATPVTWYRPHPEGTALLGLGDQAYRVNAQGRLERLEALSLALERSLPLSAEQIDEKTVAIGTSKSGVLIAGYDGTIKARVDHVAGLPADAVYALHHDSIGVLWMGVGQSLCRVVHAGTAGLIDSHHGLSRGHPLRVFSRDSSPDLIVTSRNVYRFPQPGPGAEPPALRPLLDVDEILRDAAWVNQSLWYGGIGGLWRIAEGKPTREYRTAQEIHLLTTSPRLPDRPIFAEGYDVKYLQETSFGFVPKDLGLRLPDVPVSMVEDVRGTLWISTVRQGIVRAEWSSPGAAPALRAAAYYRPGSGLPQDAGRSLLSRLGSRLFVFTERDVLELGRDGKSFEAVSGFQHLRVLLAAPCGESSAYWLVQTLTPQKESIYGLIRVDAHPDGGRLSWAPIRSGSLDHVGEPLSFGLTGTPDRHALWIGGKNGMIIVSDDAIHEARLAPIAHLRRVLVDDDAQNLSGALSPFPAASRQVTFHYAVDGAAGRTISYQTMLDGVESEWSDSHRETQRGFTGLAAGDYCFRVRALDRFGRVGPDASYRFSVAHPWFVRPPAIAGYFVVLALSVVLFVRIRTEHLEKQNERLNRLVEERTRELELANTAKSEFLESVSHEIRNPLNGLNGLLNMLQQQNLGSSARELMASVQACALGLTRVFEEVLGYSKLEYGVIPPKNAPFSLRKLLQEVADSFSWHAAQQGSRIVIDLADDFHDGFEGDDNRIKTIVANFVSNAIKYAPGTPIEVRVESHAAAYGWDEVHIDVIDQGPGIAHKEQGLIFRKFVRGSTAKKTSIAGTGLGLATCRVLAKSLQGSVGVDSEPGKGSTFYLRVPLRRTSLPAGGGNSNPPLAGGRALIVEDEHYNQVVLKGIALELGYEAEVASNAEQVEECLNGRPFDVIFVDWELPGLKGGEVAQSVRRRPGGSRPVIIAVTAHDSAEIRRQCLETGMDDFLLKPYDAMQVRDRIAESLARRDAGRATPLPQTSTEPARMLNGLNLRAFQHYARGAPGKAGQAANQYFKALDDEEAALEQAVAAGDGERIASCAHRMRALGGLVGAKTLADAARELESIARKGSAAERATAHARLQPLLETLRSRLASLTPSDDGPS